MCPKPVKNRPGPDKKREFRARVDNSMPWDNQAGPKKSGSVPKSKKRHDAEVTFEVEGDGSICAIARELVDLGWSRQTRVHWLRDGKPLFDRALMLGTWAKTSVSEESDTLRYRTRPENTAYAPHSGANEVSSTPLPEEDQ